MHESYAEFYLTDSMISGIVEGKGADAARTVGAGGAGGGVGGADGGWEAYAASGPSPPSFTGLWVEVPPPPPPRISDSQGTQDWIRDLSIVLLVAILVGFSICTYLFFSPQLLAALHYATQGRLGKQNTLRSPTDGAHVRVPTEQHDPPEGKYGRRVKVEFKRGLALRGALPRGWAKVIVQTAAVTQIKEFDVEAADDLESLKRIIFDEFNSLLASLRPDQTVLLCRELDVEGGGGGGGGGDGWHLVTSESDFTTLMDRCTTLKLVQQRLAEARATFPLAFTSSSGAQRHLQVHASAPGAGAKGGQLALRGVTGGRAKRGSSKGSGRAKRGGGSAAGRADRDGRRFSVPHQGATCSDGSASDDSAAPSRPDRTTARTVIGVPSADVRENRTRAPARGWDEDDLGSRRAARSTAIADDLL